jgi:hypothetical protein
MQTCRPLQTVSVVLAVFLFVSRLACAQQSTRQQGQSAQSDDATKTEEAESSQTSSCGNNPQLTAVPNRPTVSSTAEVVQCGVLEIEYGAEAANGHQNINGLIKFGLLKSLELRFANNPFQRDASVAGMGDSGAGFKYRAFSQRRLLPTFSILYAATFPTSTGAPGIGAAGQGVDLLLSKDFGKHHFDFNEGVRFLGRPHIGGYDRTYFTAFDYGRPIAGKFGGTIEISGFSRANTATPASMTILLSLTYTPKSRLVFDIGEYTTVYGNLPRATFFAGATYSIGDLYPARSRGRKNNQQP